MDAYKSARTDTDYYYAYSLMDDLIDYMKYVNDSTTISYVYKYVSNVDPSYHGHKYPQGDLLEVMTNAVKYN